MTRFPIAAAFAVTLVAGAAQAQDGQAVFQAFDRFCVATAGDRPAIDQAAAAAGWTPVTLTAEMLEGPAEERAGWAAPDGSGLSLLTSLSPAASADQPRVRACIVMGGAAGVNVDVASRMQARLGLPGLDVGGQHLWLASGGAPFVDEMGLIAADGPEAMVAAALQRPLFMITVMDDEGSTGAGLMRMSR